MDQPEREPARSLREAFDREMPDDGSEFPATATFTWGLGIYYKVKIEVQGLTFHGHLWGIGAGGYAKGTGTFRSFDPAVFDGKWDIVAAFDATPEVAVGFMRGLKFYGGFTGNFFAGSGAMKGGGSWGPELEEGPPGTD